MKFKSTAYCLVALLLVVYSHPMTPMAANSKLPEEAAFGIKPVQPHPNPEARQYITKTVKTNPTPMDFNGEADKTTLSVVISGHVLVFEPGHDNGLWESYHNNKTLKSLDLHADTIIIRGALRLPQTALTLYARDLRFEDQAETASINTTPYSRDIPALAQQAGLPGNPGGEITLHVNSASLGNTSAKRLILDGGHGQEGGQGKVGANASDTKLFTGRVDRTSGFVNKYYDFTSSDKALYVFWAKEGFGIQSDKSWGDKNARPKSGGPATPPGKSGDGGPSGTLTAPSLSAGTSSVSLQGGSGGKAAASVSGGRPGNPSQAFFYTCTWDGGCKTSTTYTATSGKSYSGTTGKQGANGNFVQLTTTFSWLTAPLFNQSLRYAKDMYLYGYYNDAEYYVDAISSIVTAYQASPEWQQLDDLQAAELAQLQDEAESMLQRLHAGLDYFGNPLGWVPGLSFEVNQSVYNNEIDTAMDVLWLTHSMQQNINNQQARKAYAQQMAVKLNNEIANLKTQYQEANRNITNLEPRINQLNTDTQNLKQKLNQRAEALRAKAEEAAFINGIRDSLITLTEYIPVANVATRVVFELPNVDPNKPLLNELFNITKDAAWDSANAAADNSKGISDCMAQSGDAEKCAIAQGVRDSQKRSALAKKQGKLAIDLIRGNSANNDAVNAELQRILAQDPRWLSLTQELQSVHKRKAILVEDLATAIDTANNTNANINKNLLTVDVMVAEITNTTDILDPRVISYTKDMAQRARHRLEQYQYYMVRSYEYRMVKAYPYTLDLNAIFDDFCKLQAAKNNNDLTKINSDGCNAEQVTLSENDFKSLGAIYKEQIKSITFDIIKDYNTGGGVSQGTAVEFDLPLPYLQAISQNPAGIKLNLVDDLNLFTSSEEDIRIRSIEVIGLEFNSSNALNYVDVNFIHTGVSKVRKAGDTYLFQHYLNSGTRPIQWITRYNGNGTLQGLQADSDSSKSLIGAIIGNNSENLKIFASPAAWADLTVTRSASPDFSSDSVNLTKMRVRVNYEYTPTKSNITTLRVAAESFTQAPPIEVLNTDLIGRGTGQGNFMRSYAPQQSVTLKAPQSYGSLQFQNWTENGNPVSNNPSYTVVMDRNKSITPVYTSLISQLLELPVTTANGQASNSRMSAGSLTVTGELTQQFTVNQAINVRAEIQADIEYQGKEVNLYVVAVYNGNWFMKDANQRWQPWNGQINALIANTKQTLGKVNALPVAENLSGLAGNFFVFFGHSDSNGNIHYNSASLAFTVQ